MKRYRSDDMNEVLHDPSPSGHSRWGRDDQLGAGNLLTQERRLSALRSIQTGALYDLSGAARDRAIAAALDLVGLADRAGDRVKTFSRRFTIPMFCCSTSPRSASIRRAATPFSTTSKR